MCNFSVHLIAILVSLLDRKGGLRIENEEQ